MAGTAGRMPRSERRVRSNETPVGIHIGLGAAGVVAAVTVSALLPSGWWRLVPVAAVLLLIGALTVDLVAAAAVAVLGYLLVMGFLVNQYGVLSWHGMSDVYRVMVFSTSAGAGLIIGAVRHWSHRKRRFMPPREWSAGGLALARGLTNVSIKEEVPGV